MSKKTVFLADSSYAIRKIAERNFAEENNYSLVTFKSGQGLKEQLLEQRPYAVLVELKLPEWNGYEICSFINSQPDLAGAHVFLLRAAFDPVEEEKLQDLHYVDVVTKPFDHAALIESIEKLDGETPPPVPPPEMDVPEDFPEIEDLDAPSQELSFSDIKEQMDQEPPEPPPPPTIPIAVPRPVETFGDEVQPSEEITQGSIPTGRDRLSPQEPGEDVDNPFDDESLSEHIKEQENELGIGSITQEALAIEKAMAEVEEKEEEVPAPEEEEEDGEEPESQTSEALEESTIQPPEPDDEFKDFTFEDNDSFSFSPESPEGEEEPIEPPALAQEQEEEKDHFEMEQPEDHDSFDRPRPPSFLDIASSEEDTEGLSSEELDSEPPAEEFADIPPWTVPAPEPDFSAFVPDSSDEESAEAQGLDVPEPLEQEPEAPEAMEDLDKENQFDDFPGVEDPSDEANYGFAVSPEPDNTRTSESQAMPQIEEPEPLSREVEEPKEPEPEPEPEEEKEEEKEEQVVFAPAPVPGQEPSLAAMSSTDREIIMQRIEQNISQTLKDILWDIIPPIAERIIREEIESIKKEIAQSIE